MRFWIQECSKWGPTRLCSRADTFFLIYVNDLLDLLQEKVMLFADDVKFISQRSHSQMLQNGLTKAYEWSKDWNLPLNGTKCAFLTPGSSPPTPYSLIMEGPNLRHDHQLKILEFYGNARYNLLLVA